MLFRSLIHWLTIMPITSAMLNPEAAASLVPMRMLDSRIIEGSWGNAALRGDGGGRSFRIGYGRVRQIHTSQVLKYRAISTTTKQPNAFPKL